MSVYRNYSNLSLELYNTLLQYGMHCVAGSKIVTFYCDDSKIEDLLIKQFENRHHKYIISKQCDYLGNVHNSYICSFTPLYKMKFIDPKAEFTFSFCYI